MSTSESILNQEHIFVKHMVCDRCVMVVNQLLERLGLHAVSVKLGEVVLDRQLTDDGLENLRASLSGFGFDLIDDKKSKTIEQIKNLIIGIVHHQTRIKTNLSDYLAKEIGRDYSYISNLFSEVEGTTIEQYYIHQKIEKVKELLVYGELSLSQIGDELGYSSVAHLSNQFKKITGLTPSHFKKIRENKRVPIDKV
ncbi:MAG: AraC family transcriptional regulator [Chryseolinea sp.]